MSKSTGVLTAVLTILLTAACSDGGRGEQATATDEPTGRMLRGAVTFAEDAHTFRPCGEDEALWIAAGGELLGEAAAQFEAFAVIEATSRQPPTEGPGAAYGGAVAIDSVLYFGREGPSCDFAWDSFDYRARGNEPFWMLEVSDGGMRLVRPAEPDEVWESVVREQTARGLVFRPGIRRNAAGKTTIPVDPNWGRAELVIRPEPCRDSMSGAYFGLSAAFRFGNEVFAGCTLVGAPPGGVPGGS